MQPEEAFLADSVGLALLVVLDTLTPAERLAFVLHGMFDLPFDEIAPMISRSPAATRQLASRARRHVKCAGVAAPDADLARQQEVVDAFFSAARRGDLGALVAVPHPDVLRIDAGATRPAASMVVHGAAAVAKQARVGLQAVPTRPVLHLRPAPANCAAGVVVTLNGKPMTVMGFTVAEGKIAEIDVVSEAPAVTRGENLQDFPGSPFQTDRAAKAVGLVGARSTCPVSCTSPEKNRLAVASESPVQGQPTAAVEQPTFEWLICRAHWVYLRMAVGGSCGTKT